MRVVFMGTPDFAVPALSTLFQEGYCVEAVVTQPDKPKSRIPVKEKAEELKIPVYQPKRVRNQEFIEELEKINPDVMVVVAYGQILSEKILDIPKYGCLNIHASMLPAYRGAAPIQWAVINGEKESGITIMQMDKGLDTGDILLQEAISLQPKETGGSLHDKLSKMGAKLLIQALKGLEEGTITRKKQGEMTTAYASMLDKNMGHLDFRKSAKELEQLIRGLNPWPSAYTTLNGKTLKIWDADVLEETGQPGMISKVTKNHFVIACGKGSLLVRQVQVEGKKRMSADAFLRGYTLQEGTILK